MAGLCAGYARMVDLGAEAALKRSKELAFHALCLDPLTSACCAPADIKAMTEALFKAEAGYLRGYR